MYTGITLVRFYGISTIVGYLISNPIYTHTHTYIYIMYKFYGISTIVGYLISKPLYIYIYIYVCILTNLLSTCIHGDYEKKPARIQR